MPEACGRGEEEMTVEEFMERWSPHPVKYDEMRADLEEMLKAANLSGYAECLSHDASAQRRLAKEG